MPTRPEIFISATSKDLQSCRQLVRDALLTLGCVPVTQDHFAPDARTVREMLRARIAVCDGVIHLAGECYGAEPFERDPAEPRRSYTQMEYDIARELRKPVYTFICAEDFPYDAHEPEPPELRALQDAHRAALQSRDEVYKRVHSAQDSRCKCASCRRAWNCSAATCAGRKAGWASGRRPTRHHRRHPVTHQRPPGRSTWPGRSLPPRMDRRHPRHLQAQKRLREFDDAGPSE